MLFLIQPTRYLFFTGKGGVGKTSVACATAITLADEGKRVLLVSTDPASNLDHVLGVAVSSVPTPIPTVPNLSALNIDPEAAAAAYRERALGSLRGRVPDHEIKQREEEFSGACTVEIAAFDEFTSLLAGDERIGAFDHIVFDTAPTGHTLRLLSLPAAWGDFIDENPRGASCLGPSSALQQQQAKSAEAVAALADPARTTLVLEAGQLQDDLRRTQVEPFASVINSSLAATGTGDPLLRWRAASELEQIALVRDRLAKRVFLVPWLPREPIGPARLRDLAEGRHAAVAASSGV